MRYYELTACGFDGGGDATDERVLWVAAPDDAHLRYMLGGTQYQSLVLLDFVPCPDDLDFILPRGDRLLRAKLRDFFLDRPISRAFT